ncbi:hypothetical protein HPB47_015048 [Ixodes persulcatus]|uniref:Uncharacterized protein n=1 Tax=Ixodes persulcatus TaxID=34615 RepID=A0AC60QUG9_IXOPE|nr:hypothetical protein HPB47_015048 [Ixodes persulcatus]
MLRLSAYADKHHQSFAPTTIIHHVEMRSVPPSNHLVYVNLIAAATCQARLYSVAIRKNFLPPDVLGLFGGVAPSSGHGKRVCKILRSERWKQVGRHRDFLWMMCARSTATQREASRKYGELLRLASHVTEFLWNKLRATLPTKQRKEVVLNDVTYLEEASAPCKVNDILNKGPKFSLPPRQKPVERLGLVRTLADKAEAQEKERCISEGVDVLVRNLGTDQRTVNTKRGGCRDGTVFLEAETTSASRRSGASRDTSGRSDRILLRNGGTTRRRVHPPTLRVPRCGQAAFVYGDEVLRGRHSETGTRFPKLGECAHFHYDMMDLASVQRTFRAPGRIRASVTPRARPDGDRSAAAPVCKLAEPPPPGHRFVPPAIR